MRMRVLTALTMLIAGLLLSGCGRGHGGVLRSGHSIVLVGAESDGDSMAGVGFAGNVGMVGDCLGINRATVIWPHGTKIASDDPLTVDVPGLRRKAVGDHVDGGGDPYVDYLPEGIGSIPRGCRSEQVIAFFPNQ